MFMQGGDEQSRRDEHWWEERKRKKTDYQTDVERDKQTDKRDKQTDKQEELEWNQEKTVVRHDELKDGQNLIHATPIISLIFEMRKSCFWQMTYDQKEGRGKTN